MWEYLRAYFRKHHPALREYDGSRFGSSFPIPSFYYRDPYRYYLTGYHARYTLREGEEGGLIVSDSRQVELLECTWETLEVLRPLVAACLVRNDREVFVGVEVMSTTLDPSTWSAGETEAVRVAPDRVWFGRRLVFRDHTPTPEVEDNTVEVYRGDQQFRLSFPPFFLERVGWFCGLSFPSTEVIRVLQLPHDHRGFRR